MHMGKNAWCTLSALSILWLPGWTQAARPFVTDDARLTTAGSCQLESWSRLYRDSVELWALPACNPGGNLEFTGGAGIAKSDSASGTTDYVFQLKTLVRPLTPNGWGLGLAVGTVRHPAVNPGPNQFGNHYAYLPLSLSFDDDRIVLHANVGWLHDRRSDRDSTTWGIGAEINLAERWLGIVEVFGDDRHNPFWQFGARYAVVPGQVQVDATIGEQLSGQSGGRWMSFGLRLTPDHFF